MRFPRTSSGSAALITVARSFARKSLYVTFGFASLVSFITSAFSVISNLLNVRVAADAGVEEDCAGAAVFLSAFEVVGSVVPVWLGFGSFGVLGVFIFLG